MRITPAYAGKSDTNQITLTRGQDHPRVCGEKKRLACCAQQAEGSPPRMRGKATGPPRSSGPGGITPAYAGKRCVGLHGRITQGDHPRVCGEKRSEAHTLPPCGGSPPRMRGKESWQPPQSRFAGITPAYAGKRSACSPPSPHSRDHPRVCGEKFRAYAKIWNEWGSPPRMRGKATQIFRNLHCFGITPAYAGKSPASGPGCGKTGDHPRVCGEKKGLDTSPLPS